MAKRTAAQTSDDDARVVWTSELVADTLVALEKGYQVKTPFFMNDPNRKRGDIVFEYTDWEREELRKCSRDIIYFANNYCKVLTDDGYTKVVLRDYQEDVLRLYQKERYVMFLSARQSGKTISTAIYLAWYLVFHFDRNVMLAANKADTAKEIMHKIKAVLDGLPFFLKPGIRADAVQSIVFDNGCRIFATSTTKRSGISFTIHLLFLDEFAHVAENLQREFYQNIYPTLSSSKKSRIIITSTPNGYDLFWELYDAAEKKLNEYAPFKVDWWQVPGRDEAWKLREIANLGSEEAFNKQYGCQFLSSESLLMSELEMRRLTSDSREYVTRDHEEFEAKGLDSSLVRWDPVFDETSLKDPQEQFVASVDLSEGVGRDYSVINLFRVAHIGATDSAAVRAPGGLEEFFGLVQVGTFRSNLSPVEDVAKYLYVMLVDLMLQDNVKVVLEYNMYGSELIKNLQTVWGSKNDFDEGTIVRYRHRVEATTKKMGLKVGGENKKVFCEKTRRMVGTGRMVVTDKVTAKEFSLFSRSRSGGYAAQSGHDDMAMSVVNACTFFDTEDYREVVADIADKLDPAELDSIEGMIDSGLSDEFGGGLADDRMDIDQDFLDMF